MNILRRKSSAGKNKLGDSELLKHVQECCSRTVNSGLEPGEDLVTRTVMILLQCMDLSELADACKFIATQLKSESHRVVMLSLATIGYLMRADSPDLPRVVSQCSSLLKNLQSVAEQRKKPSQKLEIYEQADRALLLIRAWGEGLPGNSDTKEIFDLYRTFQKKDWVRWPSEDDTRFDLGSSNQPRTNREVSYDATAPPPPRKPASLRPSSLRTFSSADTSWLRKDFDQFDTLLNSLETELDRTKDSAELQQNVLIPELVKACDKIGPQLRSMIEIVSLSAPDDQDALAPMLEMNDRLLKVIERHQRVAATPPQPAYNPFDDIEVMSQVFGSSTKPQPPMATSAHPLPRRPPPVPVFSSNIGTAHPNPFNDDDLL